jgi:hypothetical protein
MPIAAPPQPPAARLNWKALAWLWPGSEAAGNFAGRRRVGMVEWCYRMLMPIPGRPMPMVGP